MLLLIVPKNSRPALRRFGDTLKIRESGKLLLLGAIRNFCLSTEIFPALRHDDNVHIF